MSQSTRTAELSAGNGPPTIHVVSKRDGVLGLKMLSGRHGAHGEGNSGSTAGALHSVGTSALSQQSSWQGTGFSISRLPPHGVVLVRIETPLCAIAATTPEDDVSDQFHLLVEAQVFITVTSPVISSHLHVAVLESLSDFW